MHRHRDNGSAFEAIACTVILEAFFALIKRNKIA